MASKKKKIKKLKHGMIQNKTNIHSLGFKKTNKHSNTNNSKHNK